MDIKIPPPPSPSPPSPPSMNFLNTNTNTNNGTTPFMTLPSSPQRPLNFFFSAPSSPRHSSHSNPFLTLQHQQQEQEEEDEENEENDEDDYEFEFSGQLDSMSRPSLSTADELFHGGKIRPLKPPLYITPVSVSPKSPVSKQSNKNSIIEEEEIPLKFNDQIRGRSRDFSTSRSNSRKGISRSLSPLRVSEFAQQNSKQIPNQSCNKWGSRKWRLKDFLLFRSASEGRASTTGKDPLRKYFFSLSKKGNEEERNLGSFRSLGCSSSMADGSVSRRRGRVSAHEMHYMENRAVSGEMKKKTSLPYKHGLLGCLGFNPTLHDISKSFGPFAPS